MKVIIIEGTDNTGKDTLIKGIRKQFSGFKIKNIHCSVPQHKHNLDAAIEQNAYFLNLVDDILSNKYNADIIIFNRAWYGEYVYGPIYRERDPKDVKKLILRLEEKLQDVDVSYIQLLSNNINLLVKNDDGKSLANNKTPLMFVEFKHFQQIFRASKIKKKKLITVNDEKGKFKSKKWILETAMKTINKKNMI